MPEPFLKWPGGKRWLLRHKGLFPTRFRRYLEPFLGSGAVFFHLAPPGAILSDTNAELINTYKCLKRHASSIDSRLRTLQGQHNRATYYRIRSTRPTTAVEKAVRFIYLNRTCFNGIYRVNRRGEFNVPIGSKYSVEYPDDHLAAVASCLVGTEVEIADFEQTIDRARRDDFLFVDPPYTVTHNNNNFIKYNAHLFSWVDQMRLAAAVKRAAARGAQIMLSNAYHKSVRDLYRGFGEHYRVDRLSVLAADPGKRRDTAELLVTTYSVPDLGRRGAVHKAGPPHRRVRADG